MSHSPAAEKLSIRALNRALLARQMLLRREKRTALETIEHLVGMHAQVPRDPYVGLWTRLEGFEPAELERLLTGRRVARSPLLRGTVHLATAEDCLALRPLVQPVLDRIVKGSFTKRLAGVDPDALAETGRALLQNEPRTFADLRQLLGERWAAAEPQALGYSVSYLVPLVQTPPRGLWHTSGQTKWLTTEAWLGKPMDLGMTQDELVLRYLSAFGPASVNDIQAWCGLTRLREVVDRLRPKLLTFQDARGRELFDLPEAPRPDPDTPAPPRFLPEYDNVLLGHADRSRIILDEHLRGLISSNGVGRGTVLVDGVVAGTWRISREKKAAMLQVTPFIRWPAHDRDAVAEEGERLLAFMATDAEVRLVEPAWAQSS